MSDPVDALMEATRDAWSDPVEGARQAARGMLDLCNGDWQTVGVPAVRQVRRRRADSPYLLAATEAALEGGPTRAAAALQEFVARLDDAEWAIDIGRKVSRCSTVGVTSLGAHTLAVLEAGQRVGAEWEALVTDRRAIARGLGYLRTPVTQLAPEHSEAMLVAAAAAHGDRLWVTSSVADAVTRAHLHGTELVPVVHPLALLSTTNRVDFRPDSILIDVEV